MRGDVDRCCSDCQNGLSLRFLVALVFPLILAQGCDPGVEYYKADAGSLAQPAEKLELPKSSKSTRPPVPKPPPPPLPTIDKVHPDVRVAIQLNLAAYDTLLVTFVDPLDVDKFKSIPRAQLADTMTALRDPFYDADSLSLNVNYGIFELRRFWLVHALLVEMPLAMVDSLALRRDVTRIEPLRSGSPPSAGETQKASHHVCGIQGVTNVDYVRERITSAAFESNGYNSGHIALFDTGVWDSHNVLVDNDRLTGRHNCVPLVCNELDPQQLQGDEKPEGHGTSTASILIGMDDPGSPDTGLLDATLDSYKVYETTEAGVEAVPEAVVCAMQQAIIADPPYDLFVAEVAVPAGGEGAVTMAASRAYLWDILVIAANGNDGDDIPTPAVAPRVIGVGDYCVLSELFEYDHVHGLTVDSRHKPDMTGPTATYTAGNGEAQTADDGAGDPDDMHLYTGTSGATPYVSAVALMLKNWIAAVSDTEASPGLVYAVLLALARSEGAAEPEGAGRVMLPDQGAVLWGELSLTTQDAWVIPLEDLSQYGDRLEAVVWWPISSPFGWAIPLPQHRSDIDLSIVGSDGDIFIESRSSASSFERIELGNLDEHDASVIEVYGYGIPLGPQKAYWAAWVHPSPSPQLAVE